MSQVLGMQLGVLAALAGGMAAAGCKNPADPFKEDLDSLRTATEAFADVTKATAAGYNTELTPCMSDPQLGGMGFHVGHPGRIDGTVELTRPEVVMYEPLASGGRQLVGLEFLVPFDAWTAPNPPVLMGQTYKRNEAFGVWALHVWLYKENPGGTFADWNPRVSCANAPPAASKSPHSGH
jgi:hypothetical protein